MVMSDTYIHMCVIVEGGRHKNIFWGIVKIRKNQWVKNILCVM